jgi:hypothetical protein
MSFLIAVLSDRDQAEAAYAALEKGGVPIEQVAVLGEGFAQEDQFGFINPGSQNKTLKRLTFFWLVPFGFIAGFGFSTITNLQTFAWAGEWGNHLLGGLLGAISGAMGSVFIGKSLSMSAPAIDPLPYQNRLAEGKYVIVVNGPEVLTNRATPILRKFKTDTVQRYSDPNSF